MIQPILLSIPMIHLHFYLDLKREWVKNCAQNHNQVQSIHEEGGSRIQDHQMVQVGASLLDLELDFCSRFLVLKGALQYLKMRKVFFICQ
jgi:hypothetical protein